MPAAMPSINLLGQEELEHSPWGRIISWATTNGRYIMIATEIVVLLAFISRFSLDRKLTDLKEEIAQKQAIIETNRPFESEIRSIQERIKSIKMFLGEQAEPIQILTELQTFLPTDVYLESFDLTGDKLTAKTVAGTNQGFSQFLANLQSSNRITSVEIGEIKKDPLTGIRFQFTAQIRKIGAKRS